MFRIKLFLLAFITYFSGISCSLDSETSEQVVERINQSLSPELQQAAYLRNKSKNLADWLQSKKIYESYLKNNPNDAIAHYKFCEFHRLVNPKIAQFHCEKALSIIDEGQEKRLSSKLAKDLYISDISNETCNMALYNQDFDKAIVFCERSLNTDSTQSDPILVMETESKIKSAKRKDSSIILLSSKPVCKTDKNSPLCN